MSESTASEYFARLKNFQTFLANKYGTLDIDNLVFRIKKGTQDPYDILNSYAAYLKNHNISALTLKQRIVTVRTFLNITRSI